jgi:Spy/CpxP family protein refolding chaperone
MKINRTIIAAAACLTIGAVATLAAGAQSNDDNGFLTRGFIVRRIEHKLNITAPQRAQIKTILQTEKPAIQALVVRVHEENQQLTAKDTFDEQYVRTFAQQHAATMTDVLVEREKVRTEVLQVLTPEQREKVKKFRAAMSDRLANRLAGMPDDASASL